MFMLKVIGLFLIRPHDRHEEGDENECALT